MVDHEETAFVGVSADLIISQDFVKMYPGEKNLQLNAAQLERCLAELTVG